MYDPLVPYNELPPTTSLYVDASSGLARLAEDTRVAIELLRYAAKTLPDAGILLNSLTLQEARASSNVENIFTTNDIISSRINLSFKTFKIFITFIRIAKIF